MLKAHVMLFRFLPVPLCYEGFSACKLSAESQTLKVHPVASKALTQKRPVYAAPERLVGHFSFVSSGNQSGPIRGAPHTPGPLA